MHSSTPPTTTPMSATLKTGKFINVVANISVTKPNSSRSMKLPTAPPSSRARESMPMGFGSTFFASAAASSTDTTPESSASTQVCWLNSENAAPVF